VPGRRVIGYAGASYSVGRPFAGQLVQVTVDDGTVQIFQVGQLRRTWPRRHPPAKEASIQPDRSNQPSEIALTKPTAWPRWTT
jgi:hypothetical protein